MIDKAVVKRLAIQCGFLDTQDTIDSPFIDDLQVYTKAVIEEYKASLVPVGFGYKLSDGNYAFYKDQYDAGEPLYALGETK